MPLTPIIWSDRFRDLGTALEVAPAAFNNAGAYIGGSLHVSYRHRLVRATFGQVDATKAGADTGEAILYRAVDGGALAGVEVGRIKQFDDSADKSLVDQFGQQLTAVTDGYTDDDDGFKVGKAGETFITDGVVPGDKVIVVSGTGATPGTYRIYSLTETALTLKETAGDTDAADDAVFQVLNDAPDPTIVAGAVYRVFISSGDAGNDLTILAPSLTLVFEPQ